MLQNTTHSNPWFLVSSWSLRWLSRSSLVTLGDRRQPGPGQALRSHPQPHSPAEVLGTIAWAHISVGLLLSQQSRELGHSW